MRLIFSIKISFDNTNWKNVFDKRYMDMVTSIIDSELEDIDEHTIDWNVSKFVFVPSGNNVLNLSSIFSSDTSKPKTDEDECGMESVAKIVVQLASNSSGMYHRLQKLAMS